jgi:phage tail-like protein
MVATLTAQGVSLKITPMQIPPTTAQKGSGVGEVENLSVEQGSEIVISPGQPCRIAIELKNWESCPQSLILNLEGTFPLSWCRIPGLAANEQASVIELATVEIAAKSHWSMDLWMLVPEDFFEHQEALVENSENSSRISLNLNFRGFIAVYTQSSPEAESPPSLVEFSQFELVVHPQSHYVTFLPTVYQEVDLIHRFIKIFEQAFDPSVNSFFSMWAYLDPLTAPEALLPFLAHWVDWPIDPQFSWRQQRQLIRHAIEIYRWRGTRKGLRFFIHLYTGLPLDEEISQEDDKSISITEFFGQGCVLGVAHLGRDAVLGGGNPYYFQVRLRASPEYHIDEPLVRRIIEQEKPVFCTYDLLIETNETGASSVSASIKGR